MNFFFDTVNIGIDIVEVTRFKRIPYEKKPSLYKKIFNAMKIVLFQVLIKPDKLWSVGAQHNMQPHLRKSFPL